MAGRHLPLLAMGRENFSIYGSFSANESLSTCNSCQSSHLALSGITVLCTSVWEKVITNKYNAG